MEQTEQREQAIIHKGYLQFLMEQKRNIMEQIFLNGTLRNPAEHNQGLFKHIFFVKTIYIRRLTFQVPLFRLFRRNIGQFPKHFQNMASWIT